MILKRNKKVKPKLGVSDRLNFAVIKALKGKQAAWNALFDEESSDEDEEED